jgi:undecaprenyl diphosphate synthase
MRKERLPHHVAIIMDGNGRWAKQRHQPRVLGHRNGAESVKSVIKVCLEKDIKILTLFAFSSENWQRPQDEVNELMELFLTLLQSEVPSLHANQIQIRFIGDCARFSPSLQQAIKNCEALTALNTGLKLVIAANYGGQWDILQAAKSISKKVQQGDLQINEITTELFESHLATQDLPTPDLFIRTSGEQRISNFLLWQLAYTELYFTATHWPDFDGVAFQEALNFYLTRERRFGSTSEQLVVS